MFLLFIDEQEERNFLIEENKSVRFQEHPVLNNQENQGLWVNNTKKNPAKILKNYENGYQNGYYLHEENKPDVIKRGVSNNPKSALNFRRQVTFTTFETPENNEGHQNILNLLEQKQNEVEHEEDNDSGQPQSEQCSSICPSSRSSPQRCVLMRLCQLYFCLFVTEVVSMGPARKLDQSLKCQVSEF